MNVPECRLPSQATVTGIGQRLHHEQV